MPVSAHSKGPALQIAGAAPAVPALRLRDARRHRQQGFTLVELVVVLLVAGVLLAVGMPRFFDQLTFQEWGFSDELGGALRYAQKLAVASGCDTQVAISTGGYQLNQRASCDSGAFTTPVRLPGSDASGYAGNAPGGVTLTPVSLYFDSLGRPRASASGALLGNTTVSVGSRTFTVEAQTGYVH
ncbi:MAG: prepilin-type N-terminal cleavage/methylation domain-containing protein [Sedimenticola sp.]|nr:prepilin-type N-terminal cleavage/methylation domain-containing protein [Sedimenticola sp.]